MAAGPKKKGYMDIAQSFFKRNKKAMDILSGQ